MAVMIVFFIANDSAIFIDDGSVRADADGADGFVAETAVLFEADDVFVDELPALISLGFPKLCFEACDGIAFLFVGHVGSPGAVFVYKCTKRGKKTMVGQ